MVTITCKSCRVRRDGKNLVVEIDNAESTDPGLRLLTKADLAKRLAISERHVEKLVASGRLRATLVADGVGFKEADVMQFLEECQGGNRKACPEVIRVARESQ